MVPGAGIVFVFLSTVKNTHSFWKLLMLKEEHVSICRHMSAHWILDDVDTEYIDDATGMTSFPAIINVLSELFEQFWESTENIY